MLTTNVLITDYDDKDENGDIPESIH
jgi:hypothetical protein